VENLTFPLYRPSFLFYLVCTPCTPMFTLFCNNDMMNYVIDRFGDEVKTSPVDCEHFEAVAEVSVSQTFFAWVFQFNGDIEIIEPEPVVVKYREMLRNALEGRAVTVGR